MGIDLKMYYGSRNLQGVVPGRCYRVWLQFWEGVFRKNGLSIELKSDEFFLRDALAIIEVDDEPAAFSNHRVWNLKTSVQQNDYFRFKLSPEFLEKLMEMGYEKVLSYEYLSVRREIQNNLKLIPLAKMLTFNARNLMDLFDVDAVVGPVRRDNGVTNLIKTFGGQSLVENVERFNTKCDLMIIPRSSVVSVANLKYKEKYDELWQGRFEYGEYCSTIGEAA